MKWIGMLFGIGILGWILWRWKIRDKKKIDVPVDRFTCSRCDDNDCECTLTEERKDR